MVISRGEIWWANLPDPILSEPGYPHPLVILQSDDFNQTELNTVIGAVVTSNLRLAAMPGNVLLRSALSSLPKDSVINVTNIVTIDKRILTEYVSILDAEILKLVDEGVRFVLSLHTRE